MKCNLIVKTWDRCKSISGLSKKSKSWPSMDAPLQLPPPPAEEEVEEEEEKRIRKNRVAPEGCFSVYVGPQRQRFVIKTEYANHPLFKILLEEAESEYGFNSKGPLLLPCNVDLFCKVLLAMDDDAQNDNIRQGCGFAKGYASYRLLSPPRLIVINHL